MLLGRHALETVRDGLHDHGCGAAPPAGGENTDGLCQVAAGVAIKVAVRLQPESQPARQDTRVSAERVLTQSRLTSWDTTARMIFRACT